MSRLDDIQRRRDRRGLPSRPQPLIHAQLGQTPGELAAPVTDDGKTQPGRLADALVFGPLLIYSGLGKTPPKWLKIGLIVIGTATVLVNIARYLEARSAGASVLEGMEAGPMHKADPRFHRVISLLNRVA